jgi:hypothetical protein
MATLLGHVLEKRLSILKFYIIIVTLLPKFFYSHNWNNHVLQRFIAFIIFKTAKKFLHYELRISVGTVYIGILLFRSLWRILMRRRGSMSGILLLQSLWRILWRRGSMKRSLDKKHMVENEAEELVQLVDFEEREG